MATDLTRFSIEALLAWIASGKRSGQTHRERQWSEWTLRKLQYACDLLADRARWIRYEMKVKKP